MKSNTRVKTPGVETQDDGSTYFADHIRDPKTTPEHEIDELLETLTAHKSEWAKLDISERLHLLDEARQELWAIRDEWVQAEINAKDIAAGSFGVAEEWVILAQIFRAIRQIESTLRDIQSQGRPVVPGQVTSGPGKRAVLNVFPQSIWDRLIFLGIKGEVWLEPGIASDEMFADQAAKYRDQDYHGKVGLVLGAGNVGMLPFCDSFQKMFVELQVVILKLNPVNAHLGPMFEKSLQSFIQRGFLAVVYGGAEQGSYLCNHPLVEEIHMTGSDKTYEAIVFGIGDEGRRRKRERQPMNTKPFTGELGNITPLIIVPGPWTQSDMSEYAKHIGSWLVANAGFACLTPRVIIQHGSWPDKNRFMDTLKNELSQYPTRKAYYPGAFQIHQDFLTAHPDAHLMGTAVGDHLPWTICSDLDPEVTDDICFRREGFGGLSAEVSLKADSIEEFLDNAVDFANNTLWGTLCAILIVHPKSLVQPGVAEAVDRAIANLHYGTVAVNMLAFYSTYFTICPWGAPPGHDIYDIQSGRGKNFNFLMLDHVEKVVVKAPFKRLDPLTIRAKRADIFARKLAAFEAYPSWPKLVGLLLAALRD
ncbi:MAG: aldehyde dehydrogenase family protein [Chloroflexota bacterium]